MSKEIVTKDKHGRLHGYQEWYYNNGKILSRSNRVHGRVIGYIEWHDREIDDDDVSTHFFIR